MEPVRILIIEDEKGIADAVTYALKTEGFDSAWATTGTKGLEMLGQEEFGFVVLDLGLPDTSGFEVLKTIRSQGDLPVLILTARSEEIDRILGLEMGSDDYMVKPFSPRELTARVKTILRRHNVIPHQKQPGHNLVIDEKKRTARFHGEELELTRYELDILILLSKRPGWVFTRDMIMEQVWEDPAASFDRTVDTHIKTLRSKMKKVTGSDPIKTHRGLGYSLEEDVL